MKVALVHDFLVQDGGAERVLLALHELFPQAPIFTLFYDPSRLPAGFNQADIRPSPLNRLPGAPSHYQWYLPFMAQAVENMDLSAFDLVISSSSSFAKGVIAAPYAKHICYCHTPTRFLWQERISYLDELPRSRLIKWFLPTVLHPLRQWDRLAAERPDFMATNSQTSQERIKRYYRREAQIIHPPVEVANIPLSHESGQYWLTGGRLVAYKRFDLVVRAFAKLNLPLKIFGTGPEEKRLRNLAGAKTEFLGHVDEEAKKRLYGQAIAFFYSQVEDFGITAVEAMAAGRPVIAFGQGGATETVLNGLTGEYFDVQCWEDIADKVVRFNPKRYDPDRIHIHAQQFSKQNFQQKFKELISGF